MLRKRERERESNEKEKIQGRLGKKNGGNEI